MIKTVLLASLIVMALVLISSQVVKGSQLSSGQSVINEARDNLSKMEKVKQCYSLPKENLKQCVIDAMGWNEMEVVQAINDGRLQAYMTDQGGIVTNMIKVLKEGLSVTNVTTQQQEELNKLCGGRCK